MHVVGVSRLSQILNMVTLFKAFVYHVRLFQQIRKTEDELCVKNKRPKGHVNHLRKQFKSIITKTYNYIITLIKRRKKPHLLLHENLIVLLHLNKLECPLSKNALCQVGLKLAKRFCRRIFLNLSISFRYFIIIFPGKKVEPFI